MTPEETEDNLKKKKTNLREERGYSHKTKIGCYKIKNMITRK